MFLIVHSMICGVLVVVVYGCDSEDSSCRDAKESDMITMQCRRLSFEFCSRFLSKTDHCRLNLSAPSFLMEIDSVPG